MNNARPFVKWVGGKTALIPEIERLLPGNINSGELTYVEPFVGGGAFLFHMLKYHHFKNVIINDVNRPLIDCYNCFQNEMLYREMISRLTTLEDYYNKSKAKEEVYYKFRDEFNDRVKMNELVPSPMCSALFIFLNKTGFNGLYRVNKKGEFNVPWGKKQEVKLYDKAVFDDIAILMSKVKSCVGDYGFIQNLRYENMFIYMDPPYMPEKDESFTSYTATGFSIEEQKRLLDTCNKLNDKGVKFMQSNSNSPIIKEMYSGYNIKEVEVMRLVGAKSESRGKTKEVIITNY